MDLKSVSTIKGFLDQFNGEKLDYKITNVTKEILKVALETKPIFLNSETQAICYTLENNKYYDANLFYLNKRNTKDKLLIMDNLMTFDLLDIEELNSFKNVIKKIEDTNVMYTSYTVNYNIIAPSKQNITKLLTNVSTLMSKDTFNHFIQYLNHCVDKGDGTYNFASCDKMKIGEYYRKYFNKINIHLNNGLIKMKIDFEHLGFDIIHSVYGHILQINHPNNFGMNTYLFNCIREDEENKKPIEMLSKFKKGIEFTNFMKKIFSEKITPDEVNSIIENMNIDKT